MSAEIVEGFLCPICVKDLGTVYQLQRHFEEEHSVEENVVSQQLRGFLEKAKFRILGPRSELTQPDSVQESDKPETGSASGYIPSWWQEQELGQIRSHTDYFKATRDTKLSHFVVETNKLLIRLGKLLDSNAPTDPRKKKAFEQSVVRWVEDGDVPVCPSCQRSFGLRLRRHHCRLCGGVVCSKCSEFMVLGFAENLLNPNRIFSGEAFLKTSVSKERSQTLPNADESESTLRICTTCRRLLERKQAMIEHHRQKPMIVQLHDKLKACMKEAEQILPEYIPMLESLCQGETTYTYSQAQVLRTRLVSLYEAIDQISKKILALNTNSTKPTSGRQTQLQKTIRLCAASFMQDNLLGLQSLPPEEEYARLRDARVLEIQKKIAAERQAAMDAQARELEERERLKKLQNSDNFQRGHRRVASGGDHIADLAVRVSARESHKGHTRNSSNSLVGSGWKPLEEVVKISKTSHPVLQQMEIIRGYIRQAKQAQKVDEVIMLEQNLRDLQAEYVKMQQQQNDTF